MAASGCTVATEPDTESSADEAAEEATATAADAIVTDPSTHVTNSWCLHKKTFSGTKGRIYYPRSGGCSNPPYSPMVALFRGTGYDYGHYNYLLKHLARNGYIAVSIDVLGVNSSNHGAAVSDAVGFLNGMRANWTHGSKILTGNMGLIGHSRGGGTARALAETLDPSSSGWGVRAVVGLASTFNNDAIDFGPTDALMVLQGTHDGDQTPNRGFELYDESGDEGPAWWNNLDRSMKLLDGVGHGDFSERFYSGTEAQKMTKGYVLSFLAAHLRNDYTWYPSHVRNDQTGWTVIDAASQFTDGIYRSVLDNAEDGNVSTNTMGGSLSRSSVSASNIDLSGYTSSPHRTRALRMRGYSSAGTATWYTSSSSTGSFNAAAHVALSLRIGQVTGTAASDLTVQIRNNGSWSTQLNLETYGDIGQPMDMCVTPSGGSGLCLAGNMAERDSMATIRIPLGEFGAHNDVEAVRLRFGGDSAYKYFDIGNLAFEGWTAVP